MKKALAIALHTHTTPVCAKAFVSEERCTVLSDANGSPPFDFSAAKCYNTN